MIVAGFDVGMLNLAFCVIDTEKWTSFTKGESTDPGILAWENLNVISLPETCSGVTKKGAACECAAKWVHSDVYYCGKHYIEGCKKYKKPNTKNTNINLLRKKAFEILDGYSAVLSTVEKIAIETQPRVNQKMKMFSASIESYFILRFMVDTPNGILRSIVHSPAKNKLKVYTGPAIACNHVKNDYDRRKYLAQKHTESLLEKACLEDTPMLKNYTDASKKDDLADAFLHTLLLIGK